MHSMLKWISVLLLAAVAAAQTPSSPAPANSWLPPLTGSEDPSILKARKLLSQMIDAIGGDAYMNLQSMEQTGVSYAFYNGKPNSLGTDFHRVVKFPDLDRVELTKQRDVVYIQTADNGYEITYKGTTLQDPTTWRDYVRR